MESERICSEKIIFSLEYELGNRIHSTFNKLLFSIKNMSRQRENGYENNNKHIKIDWVWFPILFWYELIIGSGG